MKPKRRPHRLDVLHRQSQNQNGARLSQSLAQKVIAASRRAKQRPSARRSSGSVRRSSLRRGTKARFGEITAQLKTKAIQVKTGTLVDATIIASASEEDGEARSVKRKRSFESRLPRVGVRSIV